VKTSLHVRSSITATRSTIVSTSIPADAGVQHPAARSTLRASLDPLLASCLWGGMYVVSRATFAAIPPVTLGALRVVIGGLTLALALRLAGRRRGRADVAALPWRRGDHLRALACGFFVAGCILTQFLGTDLASAHDGALLTTVTPVFVVPLAWLLLGERPGWRVVVGMLVALAGVVIVVAAQAAGTGGGRSVPLLGDALLLISALCWALFTVVGAPLTRRFSALAASTSATLWSMLFLLPLVPVELTHLPRGAALHLTPGALAAVLYLAWGATALAWLLWYRGIARLEAGVAAVFFFAQPLVGGLLSGLLLHETLAAGFWLGALVLAAGILLVSWAPRRRASAAEASPARG
jgi:drug/metabolite transporter (DMT)-like permease